jgi:hypothetical protein
MAENRLSTRKGTRMSHNVYQGKGVIFHLVICTAGHRPIFANPVIANKGSLMIARSTRIHGTVG